MPSLRFDASRALTLAQQAIDIEVKALQMLRARLGASFTEAVHALLRCKGRVVVMGMGKSGHIGRKVAATLASMGTPAMFVHPGEASHGDLGMVLPKDAVIVLSNSGETEEIKAILPALKRLGVLFLVMTGHLDSSLARYADHVLDSSVAQEACPLNLGPTASTTAQLALGDALAIALLDARGFKSEDFARSHPGGALGRKLLMHVQDIMRPYEELPVIEVDISFSEMLKVMSAKGLGIVITTNSQSQPSGIFTDGDLRRLIETGADLRNLKAGQVMNSKPRLIAANCLAVQAADLMEAGQVTSLLVIDKAGRLVGALNSNDLMRNKVI
jgi:arabinose-5-phosphate isomerase